MNPQLILPFTEGVQWFITEKTIFQGSRGGPTFSRGGGGSNFFHGGGGPNATFYRNPYNNYQFQGGGGVWTPYPPLDPHMLDDLRGRGGGGSNQLSFETKLFHFYIPINPVKLTNQMPLCKFEPTFSKS